ncbi:MAG: hypothetical protein CH6_3777 [Candidatus Kapaibacterium sp.]|nr:MAG: hypothetical protein CH6_3777 [Candidatus Kapabacteria bacterium]
MKKQIAIFLIILFSPIIKSLAQVQLSGYVYDKVENRSLPGAKIQLEGTILGAVSNNDGYFKITKIPKGNYNLMVIASGYETYKERILLLSDTTISIGLKIKEISKPEVVVTASRRMQSYEDVPLSITTIDQDYFKGKNYFEMKEYVNFVSGVNVSADNISIRGSSGFQFGAGSRVTLLVDGFPFLSGDIGEANLNIISPDIANRIEILKGSGSALYGSSAMGGVVNLITKEPENALTISTQVNSGVYTNPKYEEWKYTDNIRTKSNITTTILANNSVGKLLVNAQYINDESYRMFNRSNKINFYGRYIKPFNGGKRLGFFAFANYIHSDDAKYWKGAYNATLPQEDFDLSRRIERSRFAVGVDYLSPIGLNSFYQIKTSLYRTNFESNLPKTDNNYRQSTSYSNFNEFQINHHLFKNSMVTSGITIINNWVNSFQYGDRKQSLFSFFTQGEFSILERKLEATGGIRLDYDVSDSSENFFEISPRFGLIYKIMSGFNIRTSVGKGFRVATISERFSSIRAGGYTIEPNPNLSPEKSWNFELGTSFDKEIFGWSWFIDGAIFYTRYQNLIEPQFDTNASTPTIRFRNIANSEIKGFDISIRTRPHKNFETNFNFTYLDPLDLNTNEVLKFRSRFYVTSGINFTYENLNLSLPYKFVSKIVKVEEQLRFILKDYAVRVPIHLLDFNASYNFNSSKLPLEVTFSVQNLLDYYYIDLVGNLAPTRFISLGLKYTFQK